MADGGIGGNIKNVVSEVTEAVVKPVTDEVGKALEAGVQSVVASPQKPPDPKEQQKKQEEEQKRKQWALQVIDWNKRLQEAQAQVRQTQKQEETQKRQEEQQGQQVKQVKLVEKREKQKNLAVELSERKTEQRKGVGG